MNQWAKSGTCRISIFIIIQDEFSLLKTDDLYVSYVNKINVLERERKRERERERGEGEIVYGFKMYRHYFNHMKADLSCTFKNHIYLYIYIYVECISLKSGRGHTLWLLPPKFLQCVLFI